MSPTLARRHTAEEEDFSRLGQWVTRWDPPGKERSMSRALLVLMFLLGDPTGGMLWIPALGDLLGAVLPVSLGWDPNGAPASGAGGETEVSPGWDPDGTSSDSDVSPGWDPNG